LIDYNVTLIVILVVMQLPRGLYGQIKSVWY